MQSKIRATHLNIPITTALNAAIESAAVADGQSVNNWVATQLERAVPPMLLAAAKRSEEASQRKVDEARAETHTTEMLRRMKPH
jgi:type II secretory pathway predicted ATPase ExeA